MISWIGLLTWTVDISSTSGIIRRGPTATGSRPLKVDKHISALSCRVWRAGETIDLFYRAYDFPHESSEWGRLASQRRERFRHPRNSCNWFAVRHRFGTT